MAAALLVDARCVSALVGKTGDRVPAQLSSGLPGFSAAIEKQDGERVDVG
jgi:hypothetical protein